MPASIAIVGVGPRGVSVIDRIGALVSEQFRAEQQLNLHLIDDSQLGAGRIWNTSQTKTLCMNTLAGAVTLFTEPNSTVTAPVRPGPTMFEWIQLTLGNEIEEQPTRREKTALFKKHPQEPLPNFEEEMRATVPHSNPSRALYGEYINWCYRVALAELPGNVVVTEHRAKAVGVTASSDDAFDIIELSDGTICRADSTIIASGWTIPALNPQEQEFAASEAIWVRPNSPAEQDFSALPAGEDVLVRGLGMSFYDLMALVTIDRGGRFVEDPTTRAGMRYEASGQEPHLLVSSGRGYPFLPKSDYGSLPPKPVNHRLMATIEKLKDAERIDFGIEVRPAIIKDAYEAYYCKLAKLQPEAITASIEEILDIIKKATPESIAEDMADVVPNPENRFNIERWRQPLAGVEGSIEEVTEHIAQYLEQDIADATVGHDSAFKAGMWSVSSARTPASILGSMGRYTWESRQTDYKNFDALGQMVGSGPPLFRCRQLLAVIDAGIVQFIGQRPKVRVDGDEFVTMSPSTQQEIRTKYLADAFLHYPDIRHVAEPIYASLSQRVRPFCEVDEEGRKIETASPEVHPVTRAVINPDGSQDPRVHVIGIPTFAQMADTTISPLPGTDALMLQETDKAAVHAVQVAFGS
ncbi:FAD/NAD(P)-binding protein [uncultured Rothia sp.]|uniref:FAD/NAD(P)-binding protein n=1 Tax=uncultured Rothia sp. TaxID=316088 RepID=UPI00321746C5